MNRIPKRVRSILTGIALVLGAATIGLTANLAYTQLSGGDCCYPGSPCCYEGSPCCASHHVAAR